MIKLKKIISDLEPALYEKIADSLSRNRADNFLFLLRSYRENSHSDEAIAESLELSSNSFYVLKSRLHDRIQEYLSGSVTGSRDEVLKQLHKIPEMCFRTSREVATAFLQKLEKDLLFHDMHHDLLAVYSGLKQIHLYSEKYFHYSQLYNKHIAFSLSIEKSLEMLGNFNVALASYYFSRSPRLHETMLFLRKGIYDHFRLNPSMQVQIIKNIVDIELYVFCGISNSDHSAEELLEQTTGLIAGLPESSQIKPWKNAVDFLSFEYYHRNNQQKKAAQFFESVNGNLRELLLYSHICVTGRFLVSRIVYMQQEKQTSGLSPLTDKEILFYSNDRYSVVLLELHNAVAMYYKGNIKAAASALNNLVNDHSFKDEQHIITEIKLSQVFFYLVNKEFDLSANILKNLQRKLKSDGEENNQNALQLIRIFNNYIKEPNRAPTQKQADAVELFLARNTGEKKLLEPLTHELRKTFT